MKNRIKLVKTRRDCPHNDHVDEGRKPGVRLIYDYEVFISDEHRAKMYCRGPGTVGYFLQDIDGYKITALSTDHDPAYISSLERAPVLIEELLRLERIPTLAQIAAARKERGRVEAARKRKEKADIQADKIRDAGPALLKGSLAARARLEICLKNPHAFGPEDLKAMIAELNVGINKATK